jgi:DDE superfamily endonuclease
MLDETIVTELPPLYCCYGRIGEQVRVPIRGSRAKRVLHGALNIYSGDTLLFITEGWDQETHQTFLSMVRGHWRGWNIVLFEDRAPQHKAPASRQWAAGLGIEVRLLPKATPELNAMDHLWRHTKREILSDRPPEPIDQSAQEACDYILAMSPQERLRRAGVLSGNFWLRT